MAPSPGEQPQGHAATAARPSSPTAQFVRASNRPADPCAKIVHMHQLLFGADLGILAEGIVRIGFVIVARTIRVARKKSSLLVIVLMVQIGTGGTSAAALCQHLAPGASGYSIGVCITLPKRAKLTTIDDIGQIILEQVPWSFVVVQIDARTDKDLVRGSDRVDSERRTTAGTSSGILVAGNGRDRRFAQVDRFASPHQLRKSIEIHLRSETCVHVPRQHRLYGIYSDIRLIFGCEIDQRIDVPR